MATGISLHIGLNAVDPMHYDGWDGTLNACEFDAHDMQALAKKGGFATTQLLTKAATSANVIAAITSATKALKKGDIFFITYSGHGGQVRDTNFDEPDRRDETWCLYDRELIDDEIYTLFGKFKPGVRVFALSDSCHSGSVVRAIPEFLEGGPRHRGMPRTIAERVEKANKKLYAQIQKDTPPAETVTVKASVILISGCQDNQESRDGDRNGLFTEKLKAVWNAGRYKGGYEHFRDLIANRMPRDQTPKFFTAGTRNAAFEAQKPFTIDATASAGAG